MDTHNGVLCLEDGFFMTGSLLNYSHEILGEVVFFTGMTGYEEALTDPSYKGQILVFTFPMIGNYGIPPGSGQSQSVMANAMVVRDVSERLPENYDCPIICHLNTRLLVQHLREKGVQRGIICDGNLASDGVESLAQKAAAFSMKMISEEVISTKVQFFGRADAPLGTCVVLDFGIKSSIVRSLVERGYRVCLMPPRTPSNEILAVNPRFVLLSNGPGDPSDHVLPTKIARFLLGKVPLVGICLGHQIIAAATGARIVKLKYGHHGANHPVKDLFTNQISITSQNHNYAVDPTSLPDGVFVTSKNLNDGTVEGIAVRGPRGFLALSVQFHPEGSPGPSYEAFWRTLHTLTLFKGDDGHA